MQKKNLSCQKWIGENPEENQQRLSPSCDDYQTMSKNVEDRQITTACATRSGERRHACSIRLLEAYRYEPLPRS